MSFKIAFKDSFRYLRQLKPLLVTALFIALSIVLDLVRIDISTDLRISVSFLAQAMVGMLFGPVLAMISGAATDILSYLIKPTGVYFPGFTVTAIINGLIYGVVLYNLHKQMPTVVKTKKGNISIYWFGVFRTFLSKLIVNLFSNILLNTLWLNLLYGETYSFVVTFWPRLIKNLIMWPIEGILLYVVALFIAPLVKYLRLNKQKGESKA